MPITNKPIVNYTESLSKNNQPYLSKKRDAGINFNGQICDGNGAVIWCRHITSYWSEQFCHTSGKVNYEILSTPHLLSKAISVKENAGTNNVTGDIYFVENESWGKIIYELFE